MTKSCLTHSSDLSELTRLHPRARRWICVLRTDRSIIFDYNSDFSSFCVFDLSICSWLFGYCLLDCPHAHYVFWQNSRCGNYIFSDIFHFVKHGCLCGYGKEWIQRIRLKLKSRNRNWQIRQDPKQTDALHWAPELTETNNCCKQPRRCADFIRRHHRLPRFL